MNKWEQKLSIPDFLVSWLLVNNEWMPTDAANFYYQMLDRLSDSRLKLKKEQLKKKRSEPVKGFRWKVSYFVISVICLSPIMNKNKKTIYSPGTLTNSVLIIWFAPFSIKQK